MIQITATDLKANLGKYLFLAEREDILVTKSGKKVARLSGIKPAKAEDLESLFGSVPWNGEELDIKALKAERLIKKYESLH